MKNLGTVLKIIGVIAAVAAIIFVIVRYGEAIVVWTKRTLAKMGFRCCQDATIFDSEEEYVEDEPIANDQDFAEEAE